MALLALRQICTRVFHVLNFIELAWTVRGVEIPRIFYRVANYAL